MNNTRKINGKNRIENVKNWEQYAGSTYVGKMNGDLISLLLE
jgi:hypothetical protein